MLQSIALKMVGTLEDAEDIVQDTFEKWLKIDTGKIQNTKAYLIKSVSNNSLQFLTALKQRISFQTVTADEHLEIEDDHQSKSFFNFDIEAQLNEAWSILHAKLEPIEKKLFVMREIFNIEYEELQHIFDKKKENCRKIVSRARLKIKEDSSKLKRALPKPQFPDSFKMAYSLGFITEVLAY